jgi:hypothetical protein
MVSLASSYITNVGAMVVGAITRWEHSKLNLQLICLLIQLLLTTVEQANRASRYYSCGYSKLWLHLLAQTQMGAGRYGWLECSPR